MTLLLLVGCLFELDEDAFKDQYASIWCARVHECNLGFYESEYDADYDECVDDVDDLLDDLDGGDYDEDAAADCLEQMRSISCGELYEDGADDCNDVWD